MLVLSMEHDTHCADCITYVRTYLQHTHSVGVPKDLVCFCIVAVADVCGSNEELKRIVPFSNQEFHFLSSSAVVSYVSCDG